jgi:two-component system sensor kinase FixL
VSIAVATSAPDDLLDSERFREIADAAPVGLWRINASFDQDWVNKHWLDFTGGRLEEEVGFAWVARVHPEDRERVLEEFDRAFDARQATVVEYRLQGIDGRYRWFLDRGAPFFRNGEFSGFVGSCFDITERKEAEAHLQMLQAELIDRSGAEAATILGSAVVHEVSQPLLAIGVYADGLERLITSRAELPPEFAEAAASIRLAADRARDIVKSCKEVVTSGPAERRPEKLSEVLRSMEPLILIQPAAAGAALTWNLAIELEARISATQVQQVLLNLAANGLHSMKGMSDPVLAISAARWGNAAVVSVADRGLGIPEALREQVFEPSMSGKSDGMGLGLYLSRLIVAAHGGRIWAEGNPGGGSIFRFTIPLSLDEEVE